MQSLIIETCTVTSRPSASSVTSASPIQANKETLIRASSHRVPFIDFVQVSVLHVKKALTQQLLCLPN